MSSEYVSIKIKRATYDELLALKLMSASKTFDEMYQKILPISKQHVLRNLLELGDIAFEHLKNMQKGVVLE